MPLSGMGRPLRAEEEGAIHHVYARGNRQQAIFADARDRRTYLAMLGSVVRRCRWHCLAFCLMDNHVHLLVETPFANLGDGMMRVHSPYAQMFNERHAKVGHLFQGRYGARRIRDDVHLITTLRYIARNPVEAGLCAAEHEWPWSSQAMLHAGTAPPWLAANRVDGYLEGSGTFSKRA
jgi:putative transposase